MPADAEPPPVAQGSGPTDPPVPEGVGTPEPTDAEGTMLAEALEGPRPDVGEEVPELPFAPPPQPPFVALAVGAWEVRLPSAIGRTVTIGVDREAVTLAGQRIPYSHIAEVHFKVEVTDALLHRAASARMSVQVTLADTTTVRVAVRNAASARRAAALMATATYLWDLLGDVSGARMRDDLLDRIGRGGEVHVGGLRLTAIGVAWRRDPIIPWSSVGAPELRGLDVVVPTDDTPMVVPLSTDDAYMLPSLIPALRAGIG